MEQTGARRFVWVGAVWFGLLAGLVEGLSLWAFQRLNLLGGQVRFLGLRADIIWVAPVVDVLLFLLLALVLSAFARAFARFPVVRVAAFVYSLVLFVDWLVIPMAGRLSFWAIGLLAVGLAVQVSRWLLKDEACAVRTFARGLPAMAALAALAVVGIRGASWGREEFAVSRLPTAEPRSPNLLVLVVDTLRADHLASYGYGRATSPTIDLLARQGVLFERAYATSPWTQPSHASMLTGRTLKEHGADNFRPLDDRFPTVGEILQSRGYRTAAFSANVDVFNARLGFGRGFHRFEDSYRSLGNSFVGTALGRVGEFYVLHRVFGLQHRLGRIGAPQVNDWLLRWIRKDKDRPFFALVNYYDVHAPYIPPQPYRSAFSTAEEPGGLITWEWGSPQIYLDLTPQQVQDELDAYDGAIAYTDAQIKQLIEALEREALAANTVIVVVSDHGESFGEHGLFEHHNSLYPEVIQIPLILWGPGRIPEGRRLSVPVSAASIPATLAEIAGASSRGSPFPGAPLTRLWDADRRQQVWPHPVAEVEQANWIPPQHLPFHGAMASVVSKQWQYVAHERFGEELYDLLADPAERVNLAKRDDSRAVVEQLKIHLGTPVYPNARIP